MRTWQLVAVALSLVVSFFTGALYGAKDIHQRWSEANHDLAIKHAELVTEMKAKQATLNAQLEAITLERDKQQSALADLRNRVSAGVVGMYTHGICTRLPGDTDTRQFFERGAVKLDPNVGLNILDFRERYIQQFAQLRQCRAIVESIRQ